MIIYIWQQFSFEYSSEVRSQKLEVRSFKRKKDLKRRVDISPSFTRCDNNGHDIMLNRLTFEFGDLTIQIVIL